ncbi:MAG: hypothetical protein SGJ03_16950 [Alphaproteobacteria bacterium]|nr:hypothetical protein [Alphaproteobacteria bacterium]
MRRLGCVFPEGRTTRESGALISKQCRFQPVTGFQPQQAKSLRARFGFQARKQQLHQTAAAKCWPDKHTLELGKTVIASHRTTPHYMSIQPDDEKPDTGLEHLVDIQGMTAFSRVRNIQLGIQLIKQNARFVRRLFQVFEDHVQATSPFLTDAVSSIASSALRSLTAIYFARNASRDFA